MKAPKNHERLQAALEQFNTIVRKHKRWLAVALDEVQQADEFTLDAVISAVHKTAGTDEPILFLGAGLRNVRTHLKDVRTYTERWRYLELELLPIAATMGAIQEFASAAWSARDSTRKTISVAEIRKIIPDVRRSLEREFYGDPLRRLSARELAYVIALAELGAGDHATGDVAASVGLTSAGASSIRQQLIRKDIVYALDKGAIEFRVPLMSEYVSLHASELSAMVAKKAVKRSELRGRPTARY